MQAGLGYYSLGLLLYSLSSYSFTTTLIFSVFLFFLVCFCLIKSKKQKLSRWCIYSKLNLIGRYYRETGVITLKGFNQLNIFGSIYVLF